MMDLNLLIFSSLRLNCFCIYLTLVIEKLINFTIVKKSVNISEILPKESFWDLKFDQLNADRDRSIIVPRALYFTTPQTFDRDIERLERIYNKTEILKELKSTKEPLSNKLLALVASRYHVPVFDRFSHRVKIRRKTVS